MSNIHDFIKEATQKLLGVNQEATQVILGEIEQAKNKEELLNALENTLVLTAVLHPEEDIQQAAQALLMPRFGAQGISMLREQLSIFGTIAEYFPWMGDYAPLQQENYQKFSKVKVDYIQMIVESPLYVETYLDMGRKLYMMFELEDEAKTCFEDILRINPKHDEAQYSLGRIYEKQHLYKKAKEHYEAAIRHNEENVYALLQLGYIKVNKLNLNEEGIEHYGKVVEKEPYMAEAYVRTAEAYLGLEDMERCQQFLEMALSINEYNEDALNLQGNIYWKVKGDYEKAEQTYQKGLDHQLHGDNGLLLGSLAEMYVELLEFDKAKLFFEKSLKAQPNQPRVLALYTNLLVKQYQDYGAAISAYENYLDIQENDVETLRTFANFLIDYLNDEATALTYLEQAQTLDPDEDEAARIHLLRDSLGGASNEDEDWEDDEDDDDDDDEFMGGGAAGDG
ncbi:MAG: tetratricopeptide repeat protein [Saprospiraceae bacterium]|nr:tetratricopeptide repeat protein [Saprospiraceae bacterium]